MRKWWAPCPLYCFHLHCILLFKLPDAQRYMLTQVHLSYTHRHTLSHTHKLRKVVECECVYVHALCSRGATLYAMSRDEITEDRLSQTAHSVPLWTHMSMLGQQDMHARMHASPRCLFFTSWVCVSTLCAFACIFPVFACMCVRSLAKCFNSSHIFTALQGFTKDWDTERSLSYV